MRENQLKTGKVYFGSCFRGFSPWLVGHTAFGPTEEHGRKVHGGISSLMAGGWKVKKKRIRGSES
jgi:hypothetical protein